MYISPGRPVGASHPCNPHLHYPPPTLLSPGVTEALRAFPRGQAWGPGIRLDALGDYVKLILGDDHDAALIPHAFRDAVLDLHGDSSSTYEGATLYQPCLLVALYITICRGGAFTHTGRFDTDGLVRFVAAYLQRDDTDVQHLVAGTAEARVFYASLIYEEKDGYPCALIGGQHRDRLPGGRLTVQGMPPDALRGAYLPHLSLRDASLSGIDFTGTDLSSAELANCSLLACTFDKAKMNGLTCQNVTMYACSIREARLQHAVFSGGSMNRCKVENSDLSDARFHWKDLSLTTWEHCKFRNAHIGAEDAGAQLCWSDSAILDCTFQHALINATNWDNVVWKAAPSDLAGAVIADCDFYESTLDDLQAADTMWNNVSIRYSSCKRSCWDRSALDRFRITDANFDGASFKRSEVSALSVQRSYKGQSLFAKSRWDGSRLNDVLLSGGDFTGCSLKNCEIRQLTISDDEKNTFDEADFAGTRLTRVVWHGKSEHSRSNAKKTDFSACEFDDVEFAYCDFEGATFSDARMSGARIAGSNLRGADFRDSRGVDVVSAVGDFPKNRLSDAKFDGADIGIVPEQLRPLQSRGGRDRLLNHLRNADCLLSRILDISDHAARARHLMIVIDALKTVWEPTDDIDVPLLSAMLQVVDEGLPRPAADRLDAPAADKGVERDDDSIEAEIDWRLDRHLDRLNDAGLTLDEQTEAGWEKRAAQRIARKLVALDDDRTLRKYSTLITFLRFGKCSGELAIDDDTHEALVSAQRNSLPSTLLEYFEQVAGCTLFSSDASHAVFITPDADRVIAVPPDTAPALLGFPMDQAAPENRYYFSFTCRNGDWRCEPVHAEDDFAPFPLLMTSLERRIAFVKMLLRLYDLGDAYSIFRDGFINGTRHNLTEPQYHTMLDRAFGPLTTETSAIDWLPPDVGLPSIMRPTEDHIANVKRALNGVFSPSCDEQTGIVAIGLASFMFRAASTALFGEEWNSPHPLRRYAVAWVNLGLQLYPAFRSTLIGMRTSQRELNRQALGLADGNQCAGILADKLTSLLNKPLDEHDHVRRLVQAVFCR